MRKGFAAAWMVLVGSVSGNAADLGRPLTPTAPIFINPLFDVSLSIGAMTARAKEIVYATRGDDSGLRPGAKISQLNWKTQAGAMAGLTLGWNILPATRLEGSLFAPFNSRSRMTDTDWLSPEFYPQWTDRSEHPDTRVGRSFIADLKIAQQLFRSQSFTAHGMLGFRRTEMSWKAYGGSFVYTEASAEDCASYGSRPPVFNAGSDLRNCSGAFDPVLQIAYRQKFNAPYVGVRAAYVAGPWTVAADVIGSPFVFSSDKDLHAGATLFTDEFRRQKMLGATVRTTYQFNPAMAFFIEADGQWYFTRKGTADATDMETGEYVNYGSGSAGISLQTTRLAAGIKVTF